MASEPPQTCRRWCGRPVHIGPVSGLPFIWRPRLYLAPEALAALARIDWPLCVAYLSHENADDDARIRRLLLRPGGPFRGRRWGPDAACTTIVRRTRVSRRLESVAA
jgi:hypothetical protein